MILLDELNFPEGPCFGKNGTIWLVEKNSGNLVAVTENRIERYYVGGAPNGIAIDNNNIIWFCDSKQNSIRTFDPLTKNTSTIIYHIDNQPLKMPNDLTFDKYGNLLFTCPGESLDDNTGYICCLTKDRTLKIVYRGMFYPNGLAFNADDSILYIAETGQRKIWRFNWKHKEICLENQQLFARTGGSIGPDGLAFDHEGNLYVAVYGSGQIKVWDKNGNPLESIYTIGKNPTNCAIDPKGEKGIIITEAEKGLLINYITDKRGIL